LGTELAATLFARQRKFCYNFVAMRTNLRSSDRAWLASTQLSTNPNKRILATGQAAGGYLIDDATAPASNSSGHALTAKIAPKQSNSTK